MTSNDNNPNPLLTGWNKNLTDEDWDKILASKGETRSREERKNALNKILDRHRDERIANGGETTHQKFYRECHERMAMYPNRDQQPPSQEPRIIKQ